MPSGALTVPQATAEALRLRFPQEVATAESQGARAMLAGSPADVDEAIWALGVRQVDHLGLPVLFMTWMRLLGNDQRKVILWYPSMTQGRWALARFQNAVRQRSH